jgi:hypothetical protein
MLSIENFTPQKGFSLISPVPKPDIDDNGLANIMQGDEPFFKVIKSELISSHLFVTIHGTPDVKEFTEGRFAVVHNDDISGYWSK